MKDLIESAKALLYRLDLYADHLAGISAGTGFAARVAPAVVLLQTEIARYESAGLPGTQEDRDKLAALVEGMIADPFWKRHAVTRMALAIAARNVARGRVLTVAERFENLCAAIAEDDPKLAARMRNNVETGEP